VLRGCLSSLPTPRREDHVLGGNPSSRRRGFIGARLGGHARASFHGVRRSEAVRPSLADISRWDGEGRMRGLEW